MNYLDRTFLPRIDLAREADFAVGALRVRPSRREIEAAGVCQVLQPRVMQVLVALAHPSAEVVSQDELISRCWGGLAVGEDAVGRCIGQLRRLAEQWPQSPFEIVTIAGVGYRLAPVGGPALDATGPSIDASAGRIGWRRGLTAPVVVAAAAAALAVVIGLAAWSGRDALSRGAPATVLVAIPPFEVLGQAPGLHDAARGVRDQILGVMSANLARTVSLADSEALRGADAAGAVKRLGVTLLVDGTIEGDGQSLNARIRLDDPRQHVTLWTTTVDGPASAARDLQLQVATEVADVLLCADGLQRSPSAPQDADTVALFFHACDLSENLWADARRPEQVLDALRQVIARAPKFAPGYSRLAYIQAAKTRYALGPRDPAISKEALDLSPPRPSDRSQRWRRSTRAFAAAAGDGLRGSREAPASRPERRHERIALAPLR